MNTRGNMDLIVDLFAGGGGASTAIFLATGRHPDVAVNHNPDAIDIHQANHPSTRHFRCDVREVDPIEACTVDGALRKIALLWASPDCTHHSRARGGKPVDKGIRSLATVVVEWLASLHPRDKHPTVIALENVEEFQDWGPVLENGLPCPEGKGIDFRRWVRDIEAFGYKVEWRSLVAADYGAPTTRKRLFLIARCDGEPIRWPDQTHAPRDRAHLLGKKPWRAAAEIINWNLPVPSIFGRKKSLQPKTLARIAKGIKRFVVEAERPFIVPITHTGPGRVHDTADPLRTITSAHRGEFSLVAPTIVPRYGERPGQEPRVLDPTEPYPTVVPDGNGGQLAAASLIKLSENSVGTHIADPVHTVMAGAPRHGLVAASLARQFGSTVSGRSIEDPHPTVMSDGGGGKSQVVAACLERSHTKSAPQDIAQPAPTVTGRLHDGLIAASLDAYYATGVPAAADDPLRTATAKARHGLTTAFMEQANTDMVGHDARAPVSTIVGKGCTQRVIEIDLTGLEPEAGTKRAEVLAFLWEHFGAPTEAERANPLATAAGRLKFGLVVISDAVWQIVDIGMRMLTPRELFNAQGFPFWSFTAKLEPWRDQIIREAAGLGSAPAKTERARSAAPSSSPSSPNAPSEPAGVHALIDLGRGVLQLRKIGKSSSSAEGADCLIESPLPTEIVHIARGLAPSDISEVPGTRTGAAARPQTDISSTPAPNGPRSAISYGGATPRHAAGVERSTSTVPGASRFTTSRDGRGSRPSDSTLETLFSFAALAVAGSILGKTSAANSSVELEVRHYYQIEVTLDGRPVTKTSQTSMAGNSVSPPPAAALLRVNLPGLAVPDQVAA